MQTFKVWDTQHGEEDWARLERADSAEGAALMYCKNHKTTTADADYAVTTCDEAGNVEHFDVHARVRVSFYTDRIEGHDGD